MIKLLPHQKKEGAYLASRPGTTGNFGGMGSGKTLTALEGINRLDTSAERMIIVIVGPPVSLQMWHDEYEATVGGPAQIVLKGKTPLDLNTNCYIFSYDIAYKRAEELRTLGGRVFIMDESHACKSPDAKRTHALVGSGGACEGFDYTWWLSGTPSTRYNDDVFTFLCRAAPERLKEKIGKLDLERFRLRYTIQQKRQFPGARWPVTMVVGNRNTEELNELLYGGDSPPAVRSELAEVWAAMPNFTLTRLTVKLAADPWLKKLLNAANKQSMSQVITDLRGRKADDGEESLSRLRRLLGEAKVRHGAQEIFDRVTDGNSPLLVGAWHHSVIDALASDLTKRGLKVGVMDGRTNLKNVTRLQKEFNAGELDVLIGQILKMGVSINLQEGGSHILVLEEDVSDTIMDQFYARVFRMGQKSGVHADVLTSGSKLEEALHNILGRKAAGHRILNKQGGAR